jgi:hypothetical protein
MPFRLAGYDRAKIQFTTGSWMPAMIYRACRATGVVSATVYCQRAVCEALARDLGLDLDTLLADLPTPRSNSAHLHDVVMIGPANTIEEVR